MGQHSGVRIERSRHAFAAGVALAVALVACTGSVTDVSTTPAVSRNSTSTSSSTTTTQPPSVPEALLAILSDPGFSAEITLESTTQGQGYVTTQVGSGVISGRDSMYRREDDFSQLTHAMIDIRRGNVLGPGDVTSLVEESRWVDGVLYEKLGDGLWMRIDSSHPDTTLGHVFGKLGEIEELEDLGTVTRDGLTLHHLQPYQMVDYDPAYFTGGLGADDLTTWVAITDLYADATGTPRIIDIDYGWEDPVSGAHYETATYRLEAVGSSLSVERPRAWVSVRNLGWTESFGLDLAVPDDWELLESEEAEAQLLTPEGHLFVIDQVVVGDMDADQLMGELADAQQVEILEIEDYETRMFQGVIASVHDPNGEVAILYSATLGSVGIVAAWFSPDQDARKGLFEEVLGTLTWKNPTDQVLVPGETIGALVLQTDVRNYLLSSPELACPEASVAYTKFVSSDGHDWSEDWYLLACDTLQVARIHFRPAGDGTIFGVGLPFEVVGVP